MPILDIFGIFPSIFCFISKLGHVRDLFSIKEDREQFFQTNLRKLSRFVDKKYGYFWYIFAAKKLARFSSFPIK